MWVAFELPTFETSFLRVDMKRKFTKQIKEDGVTVKLPMDTEWHVIDYDESSRTTQAT